MNSIGNKIHTLRENKKITQKELAELAGITEAALSRYEHDKRIPTSQIITRLARALDVSTDYLLSNSDNTDFDLSRNEILDIEKKAKEMLEHIDTANEINFYGINADEEDKQFLKDAYTKFLMDLKVYNKKKYTNNK